MMSVDKEVTAIRALRMSRNDSPVFLAAADVYVPVD